MVHAGTPTAGPLTPALDRAAAATALKPQDASRITVLELDPLSRDPEAAALARERIQAFADAGPALRARMLAGFDHFHRNLEVYTHALSAGGADSRQCDQFGCRLPVLPGEPKWSNLRLRYRSSG